MLLADSEIGKVTINVLSDDDLREVQYFIITAIQTMPSTPLGGNHWYTYAKDGDKSSLHHPII
jgi:hypothetical protein